MNANSLLITAICLTMIIGCKKTETSGPENPVIDGNIELKRITATPWVVYRVDVNGLNIWDIIIEACQKDDSYRFYKDSSLLQYENDSVCNGNPDSTSTHWEFYDGKKKLIGTILGITDTAGIVSLQDSEMKLSLDYNGNPALIYFRKP